MAGALLDTRSGGSVEARSAGSHPKVLHPGRAMSDGARPEPGGWNRIHLLAVDLDGEIERLEGEGLPFRNDVVSGPGGRQILVTDPSGNLVELFRSAEP